MTVWPVLMAFSVYLMVGWFVVGNNALARIGAIIFAAYVMMQLKKIGFAPEYQHPISMMIWVGAASAIISSPLIHSYGLSLAYITVAGLLLLSGTCYLWGALVGAKSGFLIPHALVSDLLAIAAMLILGSGLGRELWRNFISHFDVGSTRDLRR